MLKNAVPSPTSETSVNKKANSAKKATEGDDSDESDDEKVGGASNTTNLGYLKGLD